MRDVKFPLEIKRISSDESLINAYLIFVYRRREEKNNFINVQLQFDIQLRIRIVMNTRVNRLERRNYYFHWYYQKHDGHNGVTPTSKNNRIPSNCD